MVQSPARAYKRKRAFNLRNEWKSFTFCLMLALFLWTLTALNETYNSAVNVNLRYFNKPKNLVYSNQLPPTLRINVNARGWDLLFYYIRGGGGNVRLNLEEYKYYNYITTARLKPGLQSQIEGKVTILDIYPDTISLRKEKQFSKKVPVKLNISISYADQYGISGDIEFSPDSITITGSRENVPAVDYIQTNHIVLKNLEETVNLRADLKKPSAQNISYSEDQVRIIVPIDKLTEKVVEVPVVIVNPKFSGNVKLIPEKVTISYQTTLTKYHEIDDNLFEAVVDGSKMDTVSKNPLRVQLLAYPKYIYHPRMHQTNVDYIITK